MTLTAVDILDHIRSLPIEIRSLRRCMFYQCKLNFILKESCRCCRQDQIPSIIDGLHEFLSCFMNKQVLLPIQYSDIYRSTVILHSRKLPSLVVQSKVLINKHHLQKILNSLKPPQRESQ